MTSNRFLFIQLAKQQTFCDQDQRKIRTLNYNHGKKELDANTHSKYHVRKEFRGDMYEEGNQENSDRAWRSSYRGFGSCGSQKG